MQRGGICGFVGSAIYALLGTGQAQIVEIWREATSRSAIRLPALLRSHLFSSPLLIDAPFKSPR
jgi:hypothetical protein